MSTPVRHTHPGWSCRSARQVVDSQRQLLAFWDAEFFDRLRAEGPGHAPRPVGMGNHARIHHGDDRGRVVAQARGVQHQGARVSRLARPRAQGKRTGEEVRRDANAARPSVDQRKPREEKGHAYSLHRAPRTPLGARVLDADPAPYPYKRGSAAGLTRAREKVRDPTRIPPCHMDHLQGERSILGAHEESLTTRITQVLLRQCGIDPRASSAPADDPCQGQTQERQHPQEHERQRPRNAAQA